MPTLIGSRAAILGPTPLLLPAAKRHDIHGFNKATSHNIAALQRLHAAHAVRAATVMAHVVDSEFLKSSVGPDQKQLHLILLNYTLPSFTASLWGRGKPRVPCSVLNHVYCVFTSYACNVCMYVRPVMYSSLKHLLCRFRQPS